MTEVENAASLASQMVSEAERLVDLCQAGSEEHHEATNALFALRRVQRSAGGFDDARRGQLGPVKARLSVVWPPAPVDDPAFDV